jgi:hypothetical protein
MGRLQGNRKRMAHLLASHPQNNLSQCGQRFKVKSSLSMQIISLSHLWERHQ